MHTLETPSRMVSQGINTSSTTTERENRRQKQPEDIQPIYGFKTNWTTFKEEVDNRLLK
jgi:hypothetical protein